MILPVLLGALLHAPIYPDSLDRNSLPPEGFDRLVTVHGFDSTGRMEWAESTWVERGDGRGIRTSHSHRWTSVGHAFTRQRDAGLTNGFAVADSERVESWWGDSLVSWSLRHRIPSDIGGKWVVDGKEHDTLEIHLDGHGHEAFRRAVSWEAYAPTPGLVAHVYRMAWAEDRLVRSDHHVVQNGSDTLYHGMRTSDVQHGETVGITSLGIHFRGPAPPETTVFFWRSRWEGDSLRIEVSGHTGSNPVTERFRVTRDAHGRRLQEVSGEDGFGKPWGDTTQWIRDDEGRVLRIRMAYARFGALHASISDGSLHELSVRLYDAKDSSLPHPVTLDSAEWSEGHKVRELNYRCVSPHSLEGCVLTARREYAQRIQVSPTTRTHRESKLPLRVFRSGAVVHWVGPISDGATATLRTFDGRRLATATFRAGRAEAHLESPSTAVWELEADGTRLATGRLLRSR